MAYKNALAGLDHGGGKAVIIGDPAQLKTEPLLRAYGRFISSLGGRYITACDVGTRSEDMDVIARECAFVTGRTPAYGGAGDSSVLTALGVFQGLRAAAGHLWGSTSLRGRRVGVEGVGKVGRKLVGHLADDGADVVICDVSEAAVESVRARYPDVEAAGGATELLAAGLDVFSPCALGGSVDDDVAATLSAKIICGGANNQLAHAGVEKLLADRGILYAPDYVVNAGGVIRSPTSCPASASAARKRAPSRYLPPHHESSRSRKPRECRRRPRLTGSRSSGCPMSEGSVASGSAAEPARTAQSGPGAAPRGVHLRRHAGRKAGTVIPVRKLVRAELLSEEQGGSVCCAESQ